LSFRGFCTGEQGVNYNSDAVPNQEPVNNFWHTKTDSDTVLVFLHGIFSNSRTCWTAQTPSGTTYWPDLIQTDPRIGNPSIFLSGYHTAIDSGDFALRDCAAEVFAALGREGIDGSRSVLSYDRLVLICHSTGGIVARHMLEREVDQLREKQIGLVLLASPSRGSLWANIAGRAAEYYNQQLGRSLRLGDSALEDIHERFKEMLHRGAIPRLTGVEAAEHHMVFRDWVPRWLVWAVPPSSRVVDRTSAGQYFGQVRVMPKTDHFSIAKPSHHDHPSHGLLVDFMKDFGEDSDPVLVDAPAKSGADSTELPAPWPARVQGPTTHIYVVEAHTPSAATVAAVVCVVVDDLEALNSGWSAMVAAMMEAPELQNVAEVRSGLHTGVLRTATAHPLVRARVADALAELIFEAYAAVTRSGGGSDDGYRSLLSAVLADRIRSNRTKNVSVNVVGGSRLGIVRGLVNSVVAEGGDSGPPVRIIEESTGASVGSLVAEHVSEIVVEQFSGGSVRFARIHPAKLRVLYDAELRRYYTRRNPYNER